MSAGLLMYRVRDGELEFLLAHPGGPFWESKDAGAWTIPTGEIEPGEERLAGAKREFEEEVGFKPDSQRYLPLAPIMQRSGKIVHAWAIEGTLDPAKVHSNTMRIEWPPRSGRLITVPEVDRAGFFNVPEAILKINVAQSAFVRELVALVGVARP